MNDPYAQVRTASSTTANQWWLYDIDAFDAWDIARADGSVTVAVFDTGVNFAHEDLDGVIDTADAFDAVTGTALTESPTEEPLYHGTHVAGIISGEANNGAGIAGASYDANILPINVFSLETVDGKQTATCDDATLIVAYDYLLADTDGSGETVAERTHTRVVNLSLGGYSTTIDQALYDKIGEARTAGILTVAAGGNGDKYGNGLTTTMYPSDYDNVLSVVAIGSTDAYARFSDYNAYKDIAAPGVGIWSCWGGSSDAYKADSGTSMAAPVVSGVAALLFAYDSALTPDDVQNLLEETADDLGDAGRDDHYGYGKVDPTVALSALQAAEGVDKSALEDALAKAQNLLDETVTSTDGADVARTSSWTTESARTALEAARAAAQQTDVSQTATADAVDEATSSLEQAIETFEAARKAGTMATVWTRLWGDYAVDTMAAIDQEAFADGSSDYVVIATQNDYYDALTASALAGQYGAPVLITDPENLSAQTAGVIERLGAKHAFIVGGAAAVSEDVESQVEAMGLDVERLWGDDARGTARAIAAAADAPDGSKGSRVIIATINGFYDSLSAAPAAYAQTDPILLCEPDGTLSDETLAAIEGAGYADAVILGGTSAVSGDVEGQLASAGVSSTARLGGDNAWGTSAKVADWEVSSLGMLADGMAVADGNNFLDALTGAALCGKSNSVLVLVPHDGLAVGYPEGLSYDPYCIDNFVKPHAAQIAHGYVLGGPSAVPESTVQALKAATA